MTMTFHLKFKSNNSKVGKIPVSTSTRDTCPDACGLKGAGCYAENSHLNMHWLKVTKGERGTDWSTFLAQIAALPAGTFWRHNQAGDLPGLNNEIDGDAMVALVNANKGKRGFTYTHKPLTPANIVAIDYANARGFVVNVSCDNLDSVDDAIDLGLPVVTILDKVEGDSEAVLTPGGNKVVVCPATYRDDVSCASCQLCQRLTRKVAVGFPVHGARKKTAALAITRSKKIAA